MVCACCELDGALWIHLVRLFCLRVSPVRAEGSLYIGMYMCKCVE